MNRREFLGTVAAATVVGLHGAGKAAEGSRIRVGMFGGTHAHAMGKAKVLQSSSDWELMGIWEENATVRATYEKIGIPGKSQEELLRTCQVIVVVSDVKDHARQARIALEAGKHVHLEKPPAENVKDLRKLQEIAAKNKLLLQMGYMWRYHPAINAALEAARNGWLGQISLVRGQINTSISPAFRKALAQYRGGMMFELGCHLIDPMVRLLGKPQKITSLLKKHGEFADDLADNTTAVFEYPRAMGIISSNTLQHGAGNHRFFEIQGTAGTVLIKPIEQPVMVIDLAKTAGPYKAGSQTVPMPRYERYVPELADLAECVRTGRSLQVMPAEDLLVQETLLEACRM